MRTVGDLATFAIEQEAALAVCEAKRAGVVEIVEAANKAMNPRPWWRLW